jgi:hypothetical protein
MEKKTRISAFDEKPLALPLPPLPPPSQFALRKACTQVSADNFTTSQKMQKAY